MFGSFPPSPLVGLRLQSLLGPGSRHCYGIISLRTPRATSKPVIACYRPSSQLAFYELQGKTNMKTIALFASISIASGLMFANVYTSLVDAKSWGSDIPGSIAAAREYFKTVSPANFFRILSPLNQVLALAVLVLFWKSSSPIRM